jgi:cation diffusion facilitator family transporter
MHSADLSPWQHRHEFGADSHGTAERRTRWVVGITATMMVVEIIAGTAFGSMALLADGWHMGTHASALGVAAFAYAYSRRHSGDPRFTFGPGKVTALGGFAGAVGLAVVALGVFLESASRLSTPVSIRFDEAILVTAVGLVVNLGCAWILSGGHHHHEAQGHGEEGHRHTDHNLRGAYLHVLADGLTSVLALIALSAGKVLGWTWMDPVMGLVGSVVIARWSWGLLRDSGRVLLDAEASDEHRREIREAIESREGDRVADLHVWRVGPRHLAAIVSVVSDDPREPDHYKGLLARHGALAHVTVEVHRCSGTREPAAAPS